MKKLNLFILSEDQGAIALLTAIFSGTGRFRVKAFTDIGQAFLAFERFEPHIFFCGHLLTGSDGLAVARKVKERYPHVRSIIMTDQSLQTEILEALARHEIDSYVAKPLNRESLERQVGDMARDVAKSLNVIPYKKG